VVMGPLRVRATVARSSRSWAEEGPELFKVVVDRRRERGVLHHRFWAGDGEVILWSTEWPGRRRPFQAFFAGDRPEGIHNDHEPRRP